jgi:hypothetical protein
MGNNLGFSVNVPLNPVKLLLIFDSITMLAADVTEYGNFPDFPAQNESVKEGRQIQAQASQCGVCCSKWQGHGREVMVQKPCTLSFDTWSWRLD